MLQEVVVQEDLPVIMVEEQVVETTIAIVAEEMPVVGAVVPHTSVQKTSN